ncbi:flagellin [Thermaurantiacus tibetensis]|uniref:flagellin N-terminal helical domain-containing protein n=1 Tax=Thermaurantiacus tibetensis TaxID=2759035 RepID=UPI00188ED6DD|nr:flagellin [Thermaurantiacus tibetensis]
MSVINTNLGALKAQNGGRMAQLDLSRAMERLSTGLRINSAKDDAAGLAIAQRMTADVRGLAMAMRNAGDGISLAQTAETAMGEITNMLQRMRELAVQSSNATFSNQDRAALQAEVRQLVGEIENVATRTSFNGIRLLDGSSRSLTLQTGARAGETVRLGINSTRTSDLGTGEAPGLTATGRFEVFATDVATTRDNAVTNGRLRAGDLIINGVVIGQSLASDDTVSAGAKEASAVAKAAAINRLSGQTGVRAVVNSTVMEGSAMTAATGEGTITVNGVTTGTVAVTADAAESRARVIAAINAISGQTGVTAVETGADNLGVRLVAADGRNIEVSLTQTSGSFTAATTGLRPGLQTGTYSLLSENGRPIVISGPPNPQAASPGQLSRAGLQAGTFVAGVSQASSDTRAVNAGAALALGDLVINGVTIRASRAEDDTVSNTVATNSAKNRSAIAIAAAINASSAETGVTARANAVAIDGAAYTANTSAWTLTINGIDINILADATRDVFIQTVNQYTGLTGVRVEDNGQGLSYVAQDGRNVAISVGTGVAAAAAGLGTSALIRGSSETYTVTAGAHTGAAVAYGTVTLESTKSFTVNAGSQGYTNFRNLGFEAGTFGAESGGLRIKDVDISTQSGAQEALNSIDAALQAVAINRAELGAVQNRLEATISNLTSTSTNTVASRSRIQDADFAVETTNLARSQILQQAAQAMLAQANQQQQSVLQLLR